MTHTTFQHDSGVKRSRSLYSTVQGWNLSQLEARGNVHPGKLIQGQVFFISVNYCINMDVGPPLRVSELILLLGLSVMFGKELHSRASAV